jgi:peptidoglycan/LPS O-acetylase OafA/YrhL
MGKVDIGRVREIDSLRGVFAISVLAFHFFYRYDSYFTARPDNPFLSREPSVYEDFLGLIPVYFFFIISGFVITLTLERVPSAVDFAFARFSRLYPAYWASIFLTSAILLALPMPQLERTPFEIAVNLTMIQSVFNIPHVDGVYWSLYVELCFYLFVFFLRFFDVWRYLPRILIVWAITAVGYGFFDQKLNPVPTVIVDIFVLAYAHFFIAGMVFYRVGKQGGFHPLDWVLLALCTVSAMLRYPMEISLSIVGAFVVFGLVVTGHARILATQPLLYLGSISYSLYLIHQNIGYAIINHLDQPFWIETVIATVVAIVLSSGITYLIERPGQRVLRRIWGYRR